MFPVSGHAAVFRWFGFISANDAAITERGSRLVLRFFTEQSKLQLVNFLYVCGRGKDILFSFTSHDNDKFNP